MTAATMPFGKFKGHRLRDLPDAYLGWLHALGTLREPLKMQVEREYQRRIHPRNRPRRPPPSAGPSVLTPALRAPALVIISRGFRAAALDAHPDRPGGSHEAMLDLQAAKEALERLVKGAA
jgi:hypothetical protein